MKIEFFCGEKHLGEWEIGDSPLQLRVKEGSKVLVELDIKIPSKDDFDLPDPNDKDPKASKSLKKEKEIKRNIGDDFTMPLPIGTESTEFEKIRNKLKMVDPDSDTAISYASFDEPSESEILPDPELCSQVEISEIEFTSPNTDIGNEEGTFNPKPPELPKIPLRHTVKPLEFWQLIHSTWSKIRMVYVGEKINVFNFHVWYQSSGELLIAGQDDARIVGIHSDGREESFQLEGGSCVTPPGLPIVFHGQQKSFCLKLIKEE